MSLISRSLRTSLRASRYGVLLSGRTDRPASRSNAVMERRATKVSSCRNHSTSTFDPASSTRQADQNTFIGAGQPSQWKSDPSLNRISSETSPPTHFRGEDLSHGSSIRQLLPRFDPIYLRDICTCPICVDPSTQQRNFRTSQIPTNIKVHSVEYPEPTIARIHWINDIPAVPQSHVSEYSTPYLLSILDRSQETRPVTEWDRSLYAADQDNWIGYNEFMTSDKTLKQALTQLSRYGLVFITQIPSQSSPTEASDEEISAVSSIATRIGPLYNSFYGMTWDVKSVPNAANVAYTDVDLGFHMDLLYKRDPPYIQLLHCLRNSSSGGESLFVDTFKAARRLWNRPDGGRQHFDTLATNPMSFHYINDGQHFREDRLTFSTSPSPSNNNTTNDNGPPTLETIYYSPPFQGPLSATYNHPSSNTTPLVQALHAFEQELYADDMILEVKLDPGTCVIFENLRVAHARRAFAPPKPEDGEGFRWLRGAYVGKDDYLSRLRTAGVMTPGRR